MNAIRKLSNRAEAMQEGATADGGVGWVELAIESEAQLQEVLKEAAREGVMVFRGRTRHKMERLSRLNSQRNAASNGKENNLQIAFLNLSRLSSIVEHIQPDQVISVQSGISLLDLQTHLQKHGQWLPIEFASEDVSLADVLDTADGGYLESFSGGVKNLVLGMHAALAGGDNIKTGGKIVKNVTGYDLAKIFTGSHSWLAVPYRVHLRLYSKPEIKSCLLVCAEKPPELIKLGSELIATGLPLYGLEAFDTRLPEFCLAKLRKEESEQSPGLNNHERSSNRAREKISALEELTRLTKGHRAALLVSTRGHRSVVKEVGKSIEEHLLALALEKNCKSYYLSEAAIDYIEPLCSELLELSQYETLQFNLSPSAMAYLFQTWWLEEGKPPWSARIASARLKIGIKAPLTETSSIAAFARILCKDTDESLTVAYPTGDYDLQVERLPRQRQWQALDAVMTRLKNKFDPSGILNPLVRFCHPAESEEAGA